MDWVARSSFRLGCGASGECPQPVKQNRMPGHPIISKIKG